MPKYAAWLDRVLAGNDRSELWLVGEEPSYADLSLFQIVAGLRHAFPGDDEGAGSGSSAPEASA